MEQYIGLDVSLKETHFCVVDVAGVVLARGREAIADLAGELGDKALAIPCDVARYWEVEAAFRAGAETFGGLDVVINNAGVIEPVARIEDSDPDAWSLAFDINLKGIYNGAHAALPYMLERGGTIIGISSGAANSALEGWSHYCTSKAAAKMLTMCLHTELGGRGIRALGLSPGTVATQMQFVPDIAWALSPWRMMKPASASGRVGGSSRFVLICA